MIQRNPDDTEIKFEYFLVEGLHMAQGTLEKQIVESDVEAEETLRIKIAYNDSLCGSIKKEWGSPKYKVELKDMRRCNPS